jgi:hypothetical protein
MKIGWILITFTATLTMGGDASPLHAVDTDHFTVQVPTQWKVMPPPHSTNRWTYVFLDGTNEVFKADVWEGTSFIDCFCAPWSNYRIIKREHEEVRTVRIERSRTLKIAGLDYSLDIHASPDAYDERLIDRILASIRMKRKSANKASQAIGAPAPLPGR